MPQSTNTLQDVLIVGGGPVGLGAAILCAQNNLSVTVLEAKPGVIDKPCGEGLMPGGVKILQHMGVDVASYQPFKGIRYIDGRCTAEGHFRNGQGWGIRRTTLHEALLKRALDLGIKIEHHKVDQISQSSTEVQADSFRAKYLFIADGLNSKFVKRLNLVKEIKGVERFGIRQHFDVAPWCPDYVEITLSPNAEAYVTPLGEKNVNVAILFSRKAHNQFKFKKGKLYDNALQEFPELRDKLHDPSGNIRGAGPFKQVLHRRTLGRMLVIGDASGYLDPMTGEGVRLGFETANAAVTCVLRDQPEDYETLWKRLYARYWFFTSGLLTMRRSHLSSQVAVRLMKLMPFLFDWTLHQIEKTSSFNSL